MSLLLHDVLMTNPPNPDWIGAKQVAGMLGINLQTLYKWHREDRAPPFWASVGPNGAVWRRYERSEVIKWIEAGRVEGKHGPNGTGS